MTNKEINKAIAESLGWTFNEGQWTNANGEYDYELPKYASSLDACAEFERTLEFNAYNEQYIPNLEFVCTRDKHSTYSATARQRCEAYLRMKGLWNERHA